MSTAHPAEQSRKLRRSLSSLSIGPTFTISLISGDSGADEVHDDDTTAGSAQHNNGCRAGWVLPA